MKNAQKTLIANIRRQLALQGKSVEKFCLEHEFSKSWFYGFMALKTDISLGTIERIAKALDVDIKDLFK